MLPIGGMPILWHIMKEFAHHGVNEFILCLGYKGWLIKEFFLNYRAMTSDFTIRLGSHAVMDFHHATPEEHWRVTCADTGENTLTGGRIARVRHYLEGEEHFFLTYGDGVSDLDIQDLLAFHKNSGLVGTLTGVRVAGRFGSLEIEGGRVRNFEEKPAHSMSRVNGGFMVFDNFRIWDYLPCQDDLVLEQAPLRGMASDGQLGVYQHNGFWQCMDTPREFQMLNEMCATGRTPWMTWK